MILMSRHLTEYLDIPEHIVIRINLAWEHSVDQLLNDISKLNHSIFLDMPIGRKKPPANQWPFELVNEIASKIPNIHYLGVSNVDTVEQLTEYISKIDSQLQIVPKIESVEAAQNIDQLINILPKKPPLHRYIMIDHDDMCSDIIKRSLDPALLYTDFIFPVIQKCKKQDVGVLRTAGVVFCDH